MHTSSTARGTAWLRACAKKTSVSSKLWAFSPSESSSRSIEFRTEASSSTMHITQTVQAWDQHWIRIQVQVQEYDTCGRDVQRRTTDSDVPHTIMLAPWPRMSSRVSAFL